MKFKLVLFFTISVTIFLPSCKEEGCTNPNAINYDITANSDDGSCIVCDINKENYDYMQLLLIDKLVSSPHYTDTVGIFKFYQVVETPNLGPCGEYRSYILLDLQNLVSENLYVDFNIVTVSGPINFTYGNDIYVNPMSVFHFGEVKLINGPPFYKITQDSLKINLLSPIQYF